MTGKLCPEGWTLYRFPGPQFKDVTDPGSADHAYYLWVDRYNTLGLGNNVPIFNTNGSGVRGDLGAVVRAILMHPESNLGTATAGKLMEACKDNKAMQDAMKKIPG